MARAAPAALPGTIVARLPAAGAPWLCSPVAGGDSLERVSPAATAAAAPAAAAAAAAAPLAAGGFTYLAAAAARRRSLGVVRRRVVAQRACSGKGSHDSVPIVLLSGFLGTGKTTLMKHWLENAESRIGVVVNDVGAVNIDAKLVKGAAMRGGVDAIQLDNGCACCSLGEELITTIHDLLHLADKGAPFSHVVVELSGVAEPRRVRENFTRWGASLALELNKVVTLLDASSFCQDYMEYSQLRERPDLMGDAGEEMADLRVVQLLVEQLEEADVVVLNKIDLANEQQLSATRAVVHALNPRAVLHETSFGKASLASILEGHAEHSDGHEEQRQEECVRAEASHAKHGRECQSQETQCRASQCQESQSQCQQAGQCQTTHFQQESHLQESQCQERCQEGHCDKESVCREGLCHREFPQDCEEGSKCAETGRKEARAPVRATTAEERFGITSFTYTARRPFQYERLSRLLAEWPELRKSCLGEALHGEEADSNSPLARVIRSKGFCWLETYPSSRVLWSHAGKTLQFDVDKPWLACLPVEKLRYLEGLDQREFERVMREEWADDFGDRCQEIVFIGQRMDEAAICSCLDACLVMEGEELEAYRKEQAREERSLWAEAWA